MKNTSTSTKGIGSLVAGSFPRPGTRRKYLKPVRRSVVTEQALLETLNAIAERIDRDVNYLMNEGMRMVADKYSAAAKPKKGGKK